jgi:hypothetical protein
LPHTADAPSETAPSAARTSWTGLAAGIFAFPVMCMFLLVLLIFGFSVRGIAEPDIWWHLRNAAFLFQHHAFPSVDTYSFGAAGSPWLNFEWLSEVTFFLGLKAILLGVVSINPRTLLFGWLCMVGMLLVLDHFQRTGKGLWLLPPLFALWINLHGSWVFGMVVLGLTIASGLVGGGWGLVVARRWTSGEWKKLLLALAASLAALFLNPFGYKLLLYPFDVLFRLQNAVKVVAEWQPVDFSTGNGKLALIVIFALLAVALFSRRKWKLDEVLVMAFALWAALSHGRFLFFAGLIMAPILAPRLKLFPPYRPEIDKLWLNAGIMAAVVGWLIFSFPSSAKLQQQVSEQFPTAALEFMQRQHINGRIFNRDGWGGYMEWTTPQLKPFTDTRADIFVYNGTFDDYAKAVMIQAPFEVLDKYKIDYVLLPPKQPLGYLLEHSAAWRPIYTDKVAVLFERTPATAALQHR